MTDVTDHNHDLEDHIPTLRKLDEARKRSAKLRDDGIEVLMECLHPPEKDEAPPSFGDWQRESSLVVRALLTLQDQPSSDEKKEAKRLKLIDSLINQLKKYFTLNELAENELSVLMAASVLRALTAQPGGAFSRTAMLCYYWIIRELYSADRSDWSIGGARAAPDGLVSAYTTGVCVRALWSFAEAQQNTGKFIEEAGKYLERIKQLDSLGAHYFPEKPDTLNDWVDAEKDRLRLSSYLQLRRLSRYLVLPLDPSEIILYDPHIMSINNVVLKKEKTTKFLNENAQFLYKNAVLIVEVNKDKEWIIAALDDKGGLQLKVIDDSSHDLAKELKTKNSNEETEKTIISLSKSSLNLGDNKTINKLIKLTKFKDAIQDKIENVKNDFSKALGEIEGYRKEHSKETGEGEGATKIREKLEKYLFPSDSSTSSNSHPPSALEKKQFRDIASSESAHLIAVMAVKDASHRVQKALDFFDKGDDKEIFNKLKRGFDEAADKVKEQLDPVKNYLSSVLDRELAQVSLGESWDWQPCELACAAASYGRLTEEWEQDSRFSRAVGDLSKVVSSHGRFANPRHFHERPDGGRHMLGNAVILDAMAQLLRYNALDSEIEPDLADKMLLFFEDTRADQPRNAWLFSIMDITPKMIEKLADENDTSAIFIRNKLLPQKMKTLLEACANVTDLPKPVAEAIAGELVSELNVLVQSSRLDQKDAPFHNIRENIKKELINEELVEGEKYFFRLLNKLCLEKAFPGGIKKTDVEQAVKQVKSDKKGWAWEFSQPPLKTDLTATANAVLALAEINEMLDARINHIILEYFSVKEKNKGLKDDLTLDTLFYPDYGLRLAPDKDTFKTEKPNWIEKKDWPEKGIKREESVAITLQRMRAHVLRVSLPKKCEPLCSLVLHGPAGTGKTTLVEALAVTCNVHLNVPLVEVTPSDLVKRGEENIEERARAVFYALSLLTRAVILFDEFDPVLKRRDVATNNPLSVFSFLTPGMLPKLKDLHDQAEKRSVAYVLVTNLIGDLDEAAVRQGRFDEKLGIYPPDLLSRAGRFLDQISMHSEWKWKKCERADSSTDGATVRDAPGSTNGEGTLSFTKNDNCLTWKPFEGTASDKVDVSSNGVYELKAKNKDGGTGFLYVSIEANKLPTSNFSEKITISNNVPWDRIVEIFKKTGGKGMTTLGKPGWFTRLKEGKKPEAKTPIGFVLVGMANEFEGPEPDDELKGIRGEGRTAVRECLEWMWINAWDEKLSKEVKLSGVFSCLSKPIKTTDAKNDDDLRKALKEPASLNKLPQPKFAQSSRDQWEVMVGHRDKSFTRRMLIRRSKHDPDKK